MLTSAGQYFDISSNWQYYGIANTSIARHTVKAIYRISVYGPGDEATPRVDRVIDYDGIGASK